MRQLIHFARAGKWLESKAGDRVFVRNATVLAARRSAADAAWVYHQMLKMHMQGGILIRAQASVHTFLLLNRCDMSEQVWWYQPCPFCT